MIGYLTEVQRQLIVEYGFQEGDNGCPLDVPDGAYPMIVEKQLDMVLIRNGCINCCNFVASKQGLKEYKRDVQERHRKSKKLAA